jgi:uncharacterized membrane protein
MKRPVISIPISKTERMLDIASALLMLLTFVYLLSIWNDLPQRIPTHFNAAGEPDGWGGKEEIWTLPIIGLLLFIFISVLCKFPQLFNYPVQVTAENAPRLYLWGRQTMKWLNFELVFFFSLGSWHSVQAAFKETGLGIWYLPALIIVIFGTIIISLIRFQRKIREGRNYEQ